MTIKEYSEQQEQDAIAHTEAPTAISDDDEVESDHDEATQD